MLTPPGRLKALREIQSRATQGPWESDASNCVVTSYQLGPSHPGFEDCRKQVAECPLKSGRADAVYIVAFNPATTKELLDEIASLRSENEKLRKDEESWGNEFCAVLIVKDQLIQYADAIDRIYNLNAASRAAVVTQFGYLHPAEVVKLRESARPAPAPSEAGQGK